MLFKLALKNLLAAKLRTWLNTTILAIVLFIIIFMQGMYDGFQRQLETARIAEETGRSQLWFGDYDPLDPLSINENHGSIPTEIQKTSPSMLPILMHTATAYPARRMQPILLKGVHPDQKVLNLPFYALAKNKDNLSAIIGKRMAERWELDVGDTLTIRIRTHQGRVDARDFTIVEIFDALVPAVDMGQVWISLSALQEFGRCPNQALFG